jgi:RpiB/LacA/LacB family sugar-phosphate isomerase
MKVALGSDASSALTDALAARLRALGHSVELFGALRPGADDAWTSTARLLGEAVARGDCAQGIVCCWTGTGVSIAANKVPGVRAALCGDAATATGAREWNDANVLCLSLRMTSVALGYEILDAWLAGAPTIDAKYRAMIEKLEPDTSKPP